jgi:hypothetical protein
VKGDKIVAFCDHRCNVIAPFVAAPAALGGAPAKKSGRSTVATMKALPTDDDAFGMGSIRADGRGVFPSYLLQVKAPSGSAGEWDLYKVLSTNPPQLRCCTRYSTNATSRHPRDRVAKSEGEQE